MNRELTTDEICESCRNHIKRKISSKLGRNTVNCLYYGCDRKNLELCHRDYQIEYCLQEVEKFLKEKGKNDQQTLR